MATSRATVRLLAGLGLSAFLGGGGRHFGGVAGWYGSGCNVVQATGQLGHAHSRAHQNNSIQC